MGQNRCPPTRGLVCRVPKPNLTLHMVSKREQKSTSPWIKQAFSSYTPQKPSTHLEAGFTSGKPASHHGSWLNTTDAIYTPQKPSTHSEAGFTVSAKSLDRSFDACNFLYICSRMLKFLLLDVVF
jgi:hypothetical protein